MLNQHFISNYAIGWTQQVSKENLNYLDLLAKAHRPDTKKCARGKVERADDKPDWTGED